MQVWLRKLVVVVLVVLFFSAQHSGIWLNSATKKKPIATKKISQSKSKTTQRKSAKIRKKKSKRKARIIVRKVALNFVKELESEVLGNGVVYKKIQFGKDQLRILVHVVAVDIDSTPNAIKVLKARNSIDGLDYLKNIYDDHNFELTRVYGGELLALANANFWSAFLNYPIGILVADGEVISMKKYKEWSSIFFDEDNRPYIDNFDLSCQLILPTSNRIEIDNVNKRTNEDRVVLYNKYYGDTIPKLHIKDFDKILQETISSIVSNLDYTDSSEIEIDTNEIRNQIMLTKMEESKEFATKKLLFRYLESPAINEKVKVEFLRADTGIIQIPSDGFVLTLPTENNYGLNLKKGDQCHLIFTTNKFSYIKFMNAVSGTPRLVRKGVAKHEAYQEGSRGYRFIGSNLPRTAIGTNMSKTRIYLFVVESSRANNSVGANLTQLAHIAKKIGCYDAMNLDGGGSSILIVKGKRVNRTEGSNGRKISVAIGISTKKQ
ncbi:MAG: phosphodiester glycosidase family protein [Candidatus Kapaibacteriota bacterium]|jgi:hypothetical protein